MCLVVELKLRFAQFLYIFFAVHLFSLKLEIFLTCLVLMAYTFETAAKCLSILQLGPNQAFQGCLRLVHLVESICWHRI